MGDGLLHFIFYPHAGSGNAKIAVEIVQKRMAAEKLPYCILTADKPVQAYEFAKKAALENSSGVIAIGGDGTMSEVAAALAGTGVPVGLIPAGNGNDFYYSLKGIDPRFSPELVNSALNDVLSGKTKPVDLIKINETYSVNIASTGLDAEIVIYAEKIKNIFRRNSYTVAAFVRTLLLKRARLRLTVDGEKMDDHYTLIAIANGSRYGGRFLISPNSKINDGTIDVCIVGKMPRIRILFLLTKVFTGDHLGFKAVKMLSCKKIRIEYDGTRKINIDGNLLDVADGIDCEILPSALNMF